MRWLPLAAMFCYATAAPLAALTCICSTGLVAWLAGLTAILNAVTAVIWGLVWRVTRRAETVEITV